MLTSAITSTHSLSSYDAHMDNFDLSLFVRPTADSSDFNGAGMRS